MLGSVAVSDGKRPMALIQDMQPATHVEGLAARVDSVLKEAGVSLADIDAIACAVGPGSFTGLRVGLAFAKGLAVCNKTALVGISSLESLALNAGDFSGAVVPLIDARRHELYAAAYKIEGGNIRRVLFAECVLPPEKLIEKMKGIDGELFLTGDGLIAYRDAFERSFAGRAVIPSDMKRIVANAHNLAVLAKGRIERGEVDDVNSLAPNYIRYSDAEIGFLGRG
jgi:tRNA threonylcarbamoyladenosine biosynthesis protein TsaB